MKKAEPQGLHPTQKRYLKRQILNYLLLSSICDSENTAPVSVEKVSAPAKKRQATKKTRLQEPQPIVEPTAIPQSSVVSLEEDEKSLYRDDASDTDPRASDIGQSTNDENTHHGRLLVARHPESNKLFHEHHFFSRLRYLPKRQLAVIAGVLLFIILVQLFYPSNRALPLSRLQANGFVGFSDEREILKSFEDFDSRTVTVHTHTKTLTTSYKDLGVTLKPDETIETITDYSLKERLVPFSILVKGNKTYSLSRDLNQSQLDLYVKDVINQGDKKPVDAIVTKQGTQLLVSESEEGYEYQGEVLRSQLLRSSLGDKEQIVFAPTILPPAITTDTAKDIVKRMQQRIDSPLTIAAEANVFRIDQAMLASWVDIVHKPDQRTVDVSFNKSRIAESLRPFAGQVDYNPTPTVITLLNGSQAGKVDGAVGKSLQFDDLVDRLYAATSPSVSSIEANVTTLPPPEQIDRRYTKDSFGLQTLLNYWVANHPGDYSIDVRTENRRIEASVNPHQIRPSTGIYRLYIASLVYGRVASNSLGMNTVLTNGQTVSYCLERMIRESDDSCSSSLGAVVGWGASDSLLKNQGFESTSLTEGASLTSANDMTDWLLKLSGGQITTAAHANALMQTMSRETNRSGIPAGSVGMYVASKSGASGRTRHDVGLVHHPSGKYALAVLSDGSSFANIADLTSEINKLMSQ